MPACKQLFSTAKYATFLVSKFKSFAITIAVLTILLVLICTVRMEWDEGVASCRKNHMDSLALLCLVGMEWSGMKVAGE